MLFDIKISAEQAKALGGWVAVGGEGELAYVELCADDRMLLAQQGDDRAAWDISGEEGSEAYLMAAPLDPRYPPAVTVTEVEPDEGGYAYEVTVKDGPGYAGQPPGVAPDLESALQLALMLTGSGDQVAKATAWDRINEALNRNALAPGHASVADVCAVGFAQQEQIAKLAVPERCTGYRAPGGGFNHDGQTCPVHEA